MSKHSTTTSMRALAISLAAIQVLDIIIHTATGQLEIMRIAANVIVLLWLPLFVSSQVGTKPLGPTLKTIGLYLLLNIIFLSREGVTNAAQGGDIRIALFVFMILTAGLSVLLVLKRRRDTA